VKTTSQVSGHYPSPQLETSTPNPKPLLRFALCQDHQARIQKQHGRLWPLRPELSDTKFCAPSIRAHLRLIGWGTGSSSSPPSTSPPTANPKPSTSNFKCHSQFVKTTKHAVGNMAVFKLFLSTGTSRRLKAKCGRETRLSRTHSFTNGSLCRRRSTCLATTNPQPLTLPGNLIYLKMQPLRTLPEPSAYGPRGVLGGWGFSYGPGTPVNPHRSLHFVKSTKHVSGNNMEAASAEGLSINFVCSGEVDPLHPGPWTLNPTP